jgi:hypothetical protein
MPLASAALLRSVARLRAYMQPTVAHNIKLAGPARQLKLLVEPKLASISTSTEACVSLPKYLLSIFLGKYGTSLNPRSKYHGNLQGL